MRETKFTLALAWMLLPFFCGCHSSTNDVPVVAAAASTASGTPASAIPTVVPSTEESNVVDDVSNRDPAESPAAAAPVAIPERFLLLTPAGPLLCELSLAVGSQRHDALLDKLVDEAMLAAHSLSDESPSWDALLESRQFRHGQFGNAPVKTADERRQAVMRYDWNRNGRVDRDEMRRFVTRNQRSSGAIALRSNDPSSGQTAVAAATWQLLDADSDHMLSADEIQAAPRRLRSRDARDDDVLTADELSPPVAPVDPNRRTAVPGQRALAHLLSADTDWEELWRTIRAAYPGLRSATDGGAWRASQLRDELDRNGNGLLSTEELAGLRAHEPHLSIFARCGDGESQSSADPPLAVEARALRDLWTSFDLDAPSGRVSLTAPGLVIQWSLTDAAGASEVAGKATEDLFARYDQDSNGYLDRQEAAPAEGVLGLFDALDANADDKIYAEELATYRGRQRAASLAQIQVTVDREADAVFAALDADHDGRLGGREIAGAAPRLNAFDTNGDGQLAPGEIPDRIAVDIRRGPRATEGMGMPEAPARRAVPPVRRGPAWFQRMDTSGDGDISAREFLGTAARFAELDLDQDGFIDAREAEQAAGK